MRDWQDVIGEVVAERSDVELVDPGPRGWAVRPGGVFVAPEDVPRVQRRVGARELPQRRLRTATRETVCCTLPEPGATAALTEPGDDGPIEAQPNYVFMGQPFYMGGPGAEVVQAQVEHRPRGDAGKGVTIAVLDTGLADHAWFRTIYDPSQDDLPDSDGNGVLGLQAGHGTFIAGLIHKRAPGAKIVALRALDSDGITDEAQILEAIAALRERDEHIDILNLSFGGYTEDDVPPQQLADALAGLPSSTIVVAAAGNSASDRVFWPAALPRVYGIGALEGKGGPRAAFSNYGSWVANYRPGVNLSSTFLRFNGPVRRINGIDPDDFRWWASWSGTSFAAPLYAADVAVHMSQHDVDAPTAAEQVADMRPT